MIKKLHLFDILYNTKQPISVNFDYVKFFKPNEVDSTKTDIYFGSEEKITVWESYDTLLQ